MSMNMSNKPLVFEEIKKGMYIWDDKRNDVGRVFEVDGHNGVVILSYTGGHMEGCYYRKNRFYPVYIPILEKGNK